MSDQDNWQALIEPSAQERQQQQQAVVLHRIAS
jgi:hypothetical protein